MKTDVKRDLITEEKNMRRNKSFTLTADLQFISTDEETL